MLEKSKILIDVFLSIDKENVYISSVEINLGTTSTLNTILINKIYPIHAQIIFINCFITEYKLKLK